MIGANSIIGVLFTPLGGTPAGKTITAGTTTGEVGYSSVVPIGSISAQPVAGKTLIELGVFDAGGGIFGLRAVFTGDQSALTLTVVLNGITYAETDGDFAGKSSGGGISNWIWGPVDSAILQAGQTYNFAMTLA